MEIWRFIDDDLYEARFNMALDESIAIHVKKGISKPALRLYGWIKPSVTLGAFQKKENIDLDYCLHNDITVVRRLTGGRGVLHHDELTYSFSCQNGKVFTADLYRTYYALSLAFKKAFVWTGIYPEVRLIKRTGVRHRNSFCFAYQSYGELSFHGKKIIGSAQKRWKEGFLQQGSIPYSVDYNILKKVFKIDEKGFQDNVTGIRHLISDFDPIKLKKNIRKSFEETFKVVFFDCRPSPQEIDLAHQLVFEKYHQIHH